MVRPTTKKLIIFTGVTMMFITILTLTLPDIALNVFSQTKYVSEFKLNESKFLDLQSPSTNSTVKENIPEEITMKVQLIPHENKYLKDWYQVSNFTFVTSNTSKLCSSGNCEYKLENGKMAEALVLGERSLTGQFKVDTGTTKQIMNLSSIWKAVEKFEKDNEIIQVIEGTLKVGKDAFVTKQEYQINGTLSSNNDDYILEVIGKK